MASQCRRCSVTFIGQRRRYCDTCLPVRQAERAAEQRHRPEQAREYSRQYKLEHPEWNREQRREYYRRHPDRVKLRSRTDVNNRRAKLAGAPGTFTIGEFWALCEAVGWHCLYCPVMLTKKTATIDHIIPLGAAGCTNYLSNIAPCCRPCNARKGKQLRDVGDAATTAYGRVYAAVDG